MSEVLVVIENGIITNVVSEDEDALVHIVTRDKMAVDTATTVTLSKAESAEVSKIVDDTFDFDAYAKKEYGVDLQTPAVH